MRIVLVIIADAMALVAALLAVNEINALRRFDSFTVPFTDRMIARGVIDAGKREGILRTERIVHWVGIALAVVVWLMLTAIFAGISGAIVFPVAVAGLLAALKPDMGESEENRGRYFRAHREDIDPMKYSAYLNEAQNGSEQP